MKSIVYISFTLCLISCHYNRQGIKQIVNQWQNKEIIFPNSIKDQIYTNDSTYENRYKILNYIDTSGCTACHLKLYEWNLLKKQTDSLNLNVSFIFIAYLNNYNKLTHLQKLNKCTIPILYDSLNIMNTTNHFPDDRMFQTFLLDKNNKVLLIGNPINNLKLWKLYIKTMSK